MRSGLVFTVSNRISNRFLLCRMLAASARKMHRDGVSTSQCINNSLLALKAAPREPAENNGSATGVSQVEATEAEPAAVP
jgi:hypothetical protein